MRALIKSQLLARRRAKALEHVVDPNFRALLSTHQSNFRSSWRQHEYLAVDLETTGLDPLADQVVSFGWIPIVNGRIQVHEAKRYLVRTDARVDSSAVVHGLRQQDVAQGLALKDALAHLIAALKDRILLVHYQALDKALLDRLCDEVYGSKLWIPVVDTLEIARHKLRHVAIGADDLRLIALCKRFNLPSIRQHDALNDAFATAQLFLALVSRKRTASESSLIEIVS